MAEGGASYHRRTTCRLCGGSDLSIVLSMGPLPLANALLPPGDPGGADPLYPLDLASCGGCGLVQTPDVVDPRLLFTEYPYMTGVSDTMRAHFLSYAEAVAARVGAPPGLVVEVGSNDGSLLLPLAEAGHRVWGVDPAANVAEVARERGVPTTASLFDQAIADELQGRLGPARAVVANNVLAHVDEPVDLLKACSSMLAEGGAVVVEVPDLIPMIEGLAWDTIYHEHLSYFSAASLLALADRAGLGVEGMERVSVHGGSIRAWMTPGRPHGAGALEAAEAAARALGEGLLLGFDEAVGASAAAISSFVDSRLAAGRGIVGYGAAAKAAVVLNRVGLGPERVPFLVDRSPWKVGRRIPGVRTPIRAVSALEGVRDADLLVFPWNLIDEIACQQRGFVDRGGALILPLPRPRLL